MSVPADVVDGDRGRIIIGIEQGEDRPPEVIARRRNYVALQLSDTAVNSGVGVGFVVPGEVHRRLAGSRKLTAPERKIQYL
jgi:hypothetical protein